MQWSETSLWSQVTQELHSCPHWFALIPLILLYRNRIKWAEKRPQSRDWTHADVCKRGWQSSVHGHAASSKEDWLTVPGVGMLREHLLSGNHRTRKGAHVTAPRKSLGMCL